MVTGLWANPNYDDNKQTRRNAIGEINSNHQQIIEQLYGKLNGGNKEDSLEKHPFFKAIEDLDQAPVHQPHDHNLEDLDQTSSGTGGD